MRSTVPEIDAEILEFRLKTPILDPSTLGYN